MKPTHTNSEDGVAKDAAHAEARRGETPCAEAHRGDTARAAGTTCTLRVPPTAAGVRIDQFLVHCGAQPDSPPLLHGISRARVQRLIDAGDLRVDDQSVRPAMRLRGGERIVVHMPPPQPLEVRPEALPLDILYEDEHLIAINKPAGLVVHPGAGRQHGTLVNALLAHCHDLSGIGGVARPGIVHRLDRDTSGVLVAAKHDKAHEGLARQFAQRETRKYYLAWVVGVPSPPQDTIDTLFGRHPTQRKRFTTGVSRGKRAITRYRVLLTGAGMAQLGVWPHTGRTHQIRVHLAERGHPIVGDAVYGTARQARGLHGAARVAAQQLVGHGLHAARLELRHPLTSQPLVLEAPAPPDLQALTELMQRQG